MKITLPTGDVYDNHLPLEEQAQPAYGLITQVLSQGPSHTEGEEVGGGLSRPCLETFQSAGFQVERRTTYNSPPDSREWGGIDSIMHQVNLI